MIRNDQTLKSQKIKRRDLLTLLDSGEWVIDKQLSDRVGLKSYINKENGLLICMPGAGGGILYEDREAYIADMIKDEELKPHHVLEGIFKYGSEFPEQIEKLRVGLAKKYMMNLGDLNFSRDSLILMDRIIRQKGSDIALDEDTFPAIIAYYGETLRREIHGKWMMRQNKKYNVWEPLILGQDGKEYVFFHHFYKELYEHIEKSALSADLGYW